jgi:hypothetical protein
MIVSSFSSDAILRICERRWFLGSVVAHPTAKKDPLRREAHVLRQLMHPQAWAGRTVHTIIEQLVLPAVQKGKLPETCELIAYSQDLLKRQAEFSRQRLYRTVSKSRAGDQFCALFQDEYGQGLSPAELQEVEERVRVSLANVAKLGSLWSEVRTSQRVLPENSFRIILEGATLEAKPDLVFLSQGGTTIVDWKCWASLTADPSEQLRFYAYLLARYWNTRNLKAKDFRLLAVNLLAGSTTRVECSDDDLDLSDDRVTEFLERARNIIDGRSWSQIDLRALYGPRNPETCERCKFRGVCRDALPASDAVSAPKEGTLWLFS